MQCNHYHNTHIGFEMGFYASSCVTQNSIQLYVLCVSLTKKFFSQRPMKRFHFFFRYYTILIPIVCFALPTLLPVYLWQESVGNAFFIAAALRWTIFSNIAFSVNSFAHKFGNHPYDR